MTYYGIAALALCLSPLAVAVIGAVRESLRGRD